jgi:hypothetical protein
MKIDSYHWHFHISWFSRKSYLSSNTALVARQLKCMRWLFYKHLFTNGLDRTTNFRIVVGQLVCSPSIAVHMVLTFCQMSKYFLTQKLLQLSSLKRSTGDILEQAYNKFIDTTSVASEKKIMDCVIVVQV